MHIVHTEADGGKGGQPLRIINESLGMIQRGHQVTLLCPETAPQCRSDGGHDAVEA